MKYLIFAIVLVVVNPFAYGSEWQDLKAILHDFCERKNCRSETSLGVFEHVKQNYGYGCLVIPRSSDLRKVAKLIKPDASNYYALSYAGIGNPYSDAVDNSLNTIEQLNKLGARNVNPATPSHDSTDFSAPFDNYCGNNSLLFIDNRWKAARTHYPYTQTQAEVLLLVFSKVKL